MLTPTATPAPTPTATATPAPAPTAGSDPAAGLAALESRVAELTQELRNTQAHASGHAAWLGDLERGITDVREGHAGQLGDLDRWMTSTVTALNRLTGAPVLASPQLQLAMSAARAPDAQESLRRELQVWTVSSWLETAAPTTSTLISVVLATRNRVDYLARAVASVLGQTHTALELLVVDDASTDGTSELLAGIGDPRLRVVTLDQQQGAAAARNAALDAATGDIVAYLDDDNLMTPQWLRALAWAFDRWPRTQLLYGARLIEDASARGGQASGDFPSLEFYDYDRRRLERSNYIDMNTIAHRRGLAGWRFDPRRPSNIEWEVLLRVTVEHTPLELPVVACVYGSYAPGRLGDGAQRLQDAREIRATIPLGRPIRVLAHTAMFPMMSETYIEEEMLALQACGAEIAFNAAYQSISPYGVREKIYRDLEHAIAEHDPDVVMVYWADHAGASVPSLEALGRPFAVRVHSFDFDLEGIRALMRHPLCIGVWAFPHQAEQLPGAHSLVPIFVRHIEVPPNRERTQVLSVSAGLVKKDWPRLLEALDLLPDLDRQLIVARTNGCEHVVDELAAAVARMNSPVTLRVNVPRREIFDELARTSVCLYTLSEGTRVGMPMSVIEALYAGACVVHADRPELRGVLGESYRPYRNAHDIAAQVREVMAGGPAIEAERARNQRHAREMFCAPELGPRLHDELRTALSSWILAVG